MNKTTWLITGASSGLGRALAEHVLKQGDQVVLAARSLESMQTLAAAFPDTALALSLDVVNPAQRASVIEQTEKHFGSIDFLVNNAGIDFIGAVEEQEEADYRKISRSTFSAPSLFCALPFPGCEPAARGRLSTCRPWTESPASR